MDRVEYICPACQSVVTAPRSLAGHGAACPKCRGEVDCWSAPVSLVAPPEPAAPSHTMERNLRPARRLSARRMWVVVGSLAVVVLVVLVAGAAYQMSKANQQRENTHNDDPPASPTQVINSGSELRGCAVGERITITGKIGFGSTGLVEWTGTNAPAVSPHFSVTFPDGEHVACTFHDIPKEKYEMWIAKHPPGTIVTVRGNFWGSTISDCEVLPDGFR